MELGETLRREDVTPPAKPAPRRVGKYVLLELVGRGGWGEVWKSHDEALDRHVALKLLAGFVGDEDRARFAREAQMAARISHPNILAVYEQGRADGVDFIAMPFIDGLPFSRLRLPLRDGLACVRDAARAVHAAHASGLVHRDLKPANLMREARTGRVYVLDFGLARSVEGGSSLSTSGTVLGTPAYMPPEQARGHVHVDARADVYGLGATLYEVVTGQPPFDGQAVLDILHKVVREEPAPPRRLNPRLPADVETIVLKAMEKDPARRYASAGDFADDLDRFLRGDPIAARPASVSYRLYRGFRKHPVTWGLGAALVLALVAGAVFGIDRMGRQARAERDARRARDLSSALDRVSGLLGDLEALGYEPDATSVEIETRSRAVLGSVDAALAEFPGEARLWFFKAKALQFLGRDADAEDAFNRAIAADPGDVRSYAGRGLLSLARALSIVNPDDSDAARKEIGALMARARRDFDRTGPAGVVEGRDALPLWIAYANGRMDEVERRAGDRIPRGGRIEEFLLVRAGARLDRKRYEDAATDLRAAADRHPGDWRAWQQLGYAETMLGRMERAVEALTRALRLRPDQENAYYNRAIAHGALGHSEEAVADYTEAIRLQPLYGEAYNNRGDVLRSQGKIDAALADFEAAMRVRPSLVEPYVGRANVRHDQGRFQDAIDDIDQALRRGPDSADLRAGRASALRNLGRFNEALEECVRAIALDGKCADAYFERGLAYRALKRAEEAVADLSTGLKLNPEYVEGYNNRGNALGDVGRHEEALKDYDEAIRRRPGYARALHNRANALLRLDRVDEALEGFTQAIAAAPDLAEPYMMRGLTLKDRGDYKAALADLEAATQRKPAFKERLAADIEECRRKLGDADF